MAHFAKLDDTNKVIEVHVVANDALDKNNEEMSGIDFLIEWSNGHTKWKQTSYNAKFRNKYAAVGDFYDEKLDAFIPPQPYPSWILSQDLVWKAPKDLPKDGFWIWDEINQQWLSYEPKTF
jgi:hypothetical protein